MEQENPGLEIAKAAVEGTGPAIIDRLSNVIDRLFPFGGLKREAVNTYVEEIKRSNLSPEAKMLAIANAKKTYREMKNQAAIIEVACTAISDERSVTPDVLLDNDSELVSRLIDAGKFVSDEELQLLWGNVLAGEFEQPEHTPKNIVRILSELSKADAISFSKLCSLRVDLLKDTGNELEIDRNEIMIYSMDRTYLEGIGLSMECIENMEHLGLISYSDTGNYYMDISSKEYPYIHIISEDHVITAIYNTDSFPYGFLHLTAAGECIARFIPKKYSPQHMEMVKKHLKGSGIKISQIPGIYITGIVKKGTGMEYSFERQPIILPQTQV